MSPAARLSKVDLPVPDGPTIATISPVPTSTVISRSTSSRPPPTAANDLLTSRNEIAGAPAVVVGTGRVDMGTGSLVAWVMADNRSTTHARVLSLQGRLSLQYGPCVRAGGMKCGGLAKRGENR